MPGQNPFLIGKIAQEFLVPIKPFETGFVQETNTLAHPKKQIVMKNKIFVPLAMVLFLLSASTVYGQRGRNFERPRPVPQEPRDVYLGIDNLSAEKEAKIKQIRTAHLESRLKQRSQMDELRARRRSLMLEKSPDMNTVNAVIDQMTALRGEMAKSAIQHRQEIRNLLTDEQRVVFDSQAPRGPRQQASPRNLSRPGPRGRR